MKKVFHKRKLDKNNRSKPCCICGASVYKTENESLKVWNIQKKLCSLKCKSKSSSKQWKGRLVPKNWNEIQEKAWKSSIGNKYNLGKKHTQETKDKISKKKKGVTLSEETKQKIKKSAPRGIGHKRWKGGVSKDREYQKHFIKLYHYRKREFGGKHTFKQWEELKRKFNYMCLCCKKQEPFIKLTEDHVVPLSIWGEWSKENKPNFKANDIENIQPLCKSCNSKKWKNHVDYRESFLSVSYVEEA